MDTSTEPRFYVGKRHVVAGAGGACAVLGVVVLIALKVFRHFSP